MFRKLDCKNIEIEVIDYSLVRISSDNGQFNLNGIRSNEYPDIDFTQPNHHFVLKATDLKSNRFSNCICVQRQRSTSGINGGKLQFTR